MDGNAVVSQRFKFCISTSIVAGVLLLIFIGHLVNTARADIAPSLAADAGADFNSKCAKCHGKDGRAKSMRGKLMHARDLTNAEWQNDVSDERIFNSISNGKSKMPSFKKTLSEEQIEALVAYVRRLRK